MPLLLRDMPAADRADLDRGRATDPVVRIGAPENDPEYTEWPVPLDELGGEIDLDTILDEILSGESSSSDDEGDDSSSSDDEDDDESTTTTEG